MSNASEKKCIKVLIVEDEPVIAMDMEMTLENNGYGIFGSVTNVDQGLALLASGTPDLAILDYNLGKETSVELAKKLREKQVPFVYVTGRQLDLTTDSQAPQAPIISKPVNMKTIISDHLSQSL